RHSWTSGMGGCGCTGARSARRDGVKSVRPYDGGAARRVKSFWRGDRWRATVDRRWDRARPGRGSGYSKAIQKSDALLLQPEAESTRRSAAVNVVVLVAVTVAAKISPPVERGVAITCGAL